MRTIMKQDSYDLILSLRETIKKHNITVIPHKIKAHSTTWSPNHIADKEAKIARETLELYTTFQSYYQILHHKKKQFTTDPTKYIKKTTNYIHKSNVNQHLSKIWPDILPDPTLQTIKQGTLEQPLQTTHTKEKKFRIQTLTNMLPTLTETHKYAGNEQQSNQCPRCKSEPETPDHIWKCNETTKIIPTLLKEASTYLANKYHYDTESSTQAINNLDITETTINAPHLKGIITTSFVNSKKPIKLETIIHTIDAWMHSFYQNIWTARNNLMPKVTYKDIRKKKQLALLHKKPWKRNPTTLLEPTPTPIEPKIRTKKPPKPPNEPKHTLINAHEQTYIYEKPKPITIQKKHKNSIILNIPPLPSKTPKILAEHPPITIKFPNPKRPPDHLETPNNPKKRKPNPEQPRLKIILPNLKRPPDNSTITPQDIKRKRIREEP